MSEVSSYFTATEMSRNIYFYMALAIDVGYYRLLPAFAPMGPARSTTFQNPHELSRVRDAQGRFFGESVPKV